MLQSRVDQLVVDTSRDLRKEYNDVRNAHPDPIDPQLIVRAVILVRFLQRSDDLIGSHALIPEGKVIAPGSVVMGSPGKVTRQVTDRDLARMRESFEAYVSRGQHYARGFRLQRP